MGILNVTPDSFSDGGQWLDSSAAIAHGQALFADGADIVDVGGESTRPGADEVSIDDELARIIPVIQGLQSSGRVSVDTYKPEVARQAVAAGATLINDVSASLFGVAGELNVGWVAMHMQGRPRSMQNNPRYSDVVAEVSKFLVERSRNAHEAGVQEVWIDPGIGFGKTTQHNLSLLRHINVLVDSGVPVALGVSRKGFLGRIVGREDAPVPVDQRLEASLTVAALAIAQGVQMMRVHDVKATARAAKVACAILEAA